MGMRRLGVVGLVSLDRVDGGLPRLGGAPTYATRALRLLGHEAAVATKLAAEERPRLAALGLAVAARNAARTIAFRIENRGDRRMIALEEPGEPWTLEEARGWLAHTLAGVDVVHAGALTRDDFPARTLAALKRTRILSFDAQGLVRPALTGELVLDTEFDPEVLAQVDILKVGEEEASALEIGPDERSLGSLGVPEILLTLGRRGVVVFADGLAELVPTGRLNGIDPTGAGDAFMAAYLSFRCRGHGPTSAARCANGVAYALLKPCSAH
jgi:sugar/nucleoside kinase (ribokinase family)